jgi:hypothetical protein
MHSASNNNNHKVFEIIYFFNHFQTKFQILFRERLFIGIRPLQHLLIKVKFFLREKCNVLFLAPVIAPPFVPGYFPYEMQYPYVYEEMPMAPFPGYHYAPMATPGTRYQ